MRTLIRPQAILTVDAKDSVLTGGAILVNGRNIERVLTAEELRTVTGDGWQTIDAPGMAAMPGFVQTHIHLCQTLFRGQAEDVALLDWLQRRIFPFEAAHTAASMHASARAGLSELIRSGTTTIMDMGSVHHEEEIVRAVTESGIRAFLGKAMMDINELHPPLRENTTSALDSTLRQAEQWHGSAGGRIRYAVAPRFILSCSDPLLKEAHAMTRSFPGMLFHTHASENRAELAAVRMRCGMDNVEYFDALGILNDVTCLAHCIWLNDHEVDLLAARQSRVLHCPSSNMKLGSGIAPIPRYLERGIPVSLGSDGAACSNTLNMFRKCGLPPSSRNQSTVRTRCRRGRFSGWPRWAVPAHLAWPVKSGASRKGRKQTSCFSISRVSGTPRLHRQRMILPPASCIAVNPPMCIP